MAAPTLTSSLLTTHCGSPSLLSPASCAGREAELREVESLCRNEKCLNRKCARPRNNTRCSVRVAAPGRRQGEQRSRVVMNAVPVAIPFVATLAVVGAAVVAISKKEKLPSLEENARVECEECEGSGICPACHGDGFLMKTPSNEAAAKARANAKDAATRYTAGLAKKWSYCGTCSGGRGCPACDGRGWL